MDAERTSHRDDGSTASTAILMGDHLYVANVGDSRTVISKAGKGDFMYKLCVTFGVHYVLIAVCSVFYFMDAITHIPLLIYLVSFLSVFVFGWLMLLIISEVGSGVKCLICETCCSVYHL